MSEQQHDRLINAIDIVSNSEMMSDDKAECLRALFQAKHDNRRITKWSEWRNEPGITIVSVLILMAVIMVVSSMHLSSRQMFCIGFWIAFMMEWYRGGEHLC